MFKPVKQPLTSSEIGDLILQYAKVCRENEFGTALPEYKAYEIRRSSVNRHLQTNHPELPDQEIDDVLDRMLKGKQVVHLKDESIVFPMGLL